MMFDCKHGVAAILELQNRALASVNPSTEATVKIIEFPRARIAESARERGQRVKNNASPAKRPRGVRQPPRSPLYNKLVEHLARELTAEEADFIRRVQAAYNNAGFRSFTEADLGSLAADALPASSFNYWQQVDLYPHYPGDDFLFWLHVARELRRRNVRWPEFMDGISD